MTRVPLALTPSALSDNEPPLLAGVLALSLRAAELAAATELIVFVPTFAGVPTAEVVGDASYRYASYKCLDEPLEASPPGFNVAGCESERFRPLLPPAAPGDDTGSLLLVFERAISA